MRRVLRSLAVVLVLGAGLLLLAAIRASRPVFDEMLDPRLLERLEIADPDRALTFARRRDDSGHQLLLVTDHRDGRFEAIDLNTHCGGRARGAIELLAAYGYDAVRDAARASLAKLQVPESELDVPIALDDDRHVAAGTNFAAHAAEAGIGEPFVFPKRAVPTPWDALVPMGEARRLDYEVELCFVPLGDIEAAGSNSPLGLLLCNDFTDRWSLVLALADGEGEMGTRGFADAKGAPGFFPVGSLLVVPRDLEAFYPDIELSLWVDGRLRQRSRAGAMIWGPAEIIDQAFARSDWDFDYEDRATKLLPGGRLTAGSLILSGTPEGVIFRLVNVWWAMPYLDVGDEIVAHATYLGSLRNTVTR